MEEFKIEYEFNLEDFKRMENIEYSYFPEDNITPAKEVFKWYERNPLTCIAVRNQKKEIIASISLLPLKQEVFEMIYFDKMNEADVKADQIEEYQNNQTYFLYLSSISIDKRYRNHYRVITTLLKGCVCLYNLFLEKKIKVEKIMADASTIHGEKICKKLFQMTYVLDTNHESKIYEIEGDKFLERMERLKKYL